jgi:epoxyqueuosine reductase
MNAALSARIRKKAVDLGFDAVGICPAIRPPGINRLIEWLERGFAGAMSYIPQRLDAYADPNYVLDGAQSIVMLSANYRTDEPRTAEPGFGRVARYAWGEADYHDVTHGRLKALAQFMADEAPGSTSRGVVDSAPLMEHQFAQLAGLGWIGKNTLLLSRDAGSYFFLAALLTDVALAYDQPHAADHCGSCTACLDACPTEAFPEPYVLDATKCISYLTIELRDPIPKNQRPGLGNWVFGCDICQEVCPWNNKAPMSGDSRFAPRPDQNPMELTSLFELDDEAFRRRFRKTPLWRSKRGGLLRNAAYVLGNQKAGHALRALIRGLSDTDPLVRGSCAWALGQFQQVSARHALQARRSIEPDETVCHEIDAALS